MSAIIFTVCLPFAAYGIESATAEYVENEIVFEYAPPTSSGKAARSTSNFRSQLKALGVTEIKELDNYDDTIYTNSISAEPITYVATISGDVEKTCHEVEKISGINYAEPNYLLETTDFSMPTEVSGKIANYTNYQKWYFDTVMNIPAAWEKYQTAGEGVTIAVIDNGFYIDATDFPTNLWNDGNGHHGRNTASDSYDLSPAYKPDGSALLDSAHGSNVAGIIGMASNGKNFIGAAFDAKLMLLKVASDSYTSSDTKTKISSSAVANAIVYARRNNADIISMSLGIIGTYPMAIRNAIDDAYADSIVIVASAGNNGYGTETALSYPAAAANVIGVMASDKTNTSSLTYFSNYDEHDGKYYDVVAPGVEIIGCGIEKNKFSIMSGTSQSAPLVAACAALYLSAYPDQTVDKVYEAIRKSSGKAAVSYTENSPTKTYTYKILDAVELLDYGSIKPEVEFNLNTMVISDPKTGYLYGFDEGFTDISNYVTVKSGTGTMEFIPTAHGNGTGSQLKIYTLSGELYKTYTVIIFGDINGDCKADGEDSVLIGCMINNFGNYDKCQSYAADVDFDGSASESDAQTVCGYALGQENISQIR